MTAGTQEYIHRGINEEVTAIGGHYILTGEVRLPFKGKEILYLTGQALLDTSCCGPGGCAYALVRGTIVSWKRKKTAEGYWVTDVLSIRDKFSRGEIQKIINGKETVTQVLFL